ncbi:Protein of unknown function (DUF1565) [Clostridium sp. ASBs410]|nr:Protein of unknown function (DUF1565) [Clostridium sp. ASBs410]
MDHKYLSYTGLKRFFYTKILKQINLKIDKTNGDISNTKIRSVETFDTKFPIPAAGETAKQFLGKVLTFLKNIKPLESDATYYVSTASGNDITGDGSQEKPFNTITKALNSIPKNLGGCIATVNIADGTYGTTGFSLNKYYNGTIRMVGNETSPGNVVIPSTMTSFTIGDTYAVKFVISGINFKVTGNNSCIHLYNTYSVSFNNCIIEGNKTAGINWNTASLKVTDTVFNKCNFCIWSPNTSTAWQTNTDSNLVARIGSCNGTENGSIALIEKGILQFIDNILPETTSAPTIKTGAMLVKGSGAVIGTLQSNTTYYVSTSGSDSNDGTSAKPFKTIKHTLDVIPKDLGGFTATIQIADGIYDEEVKVTGYYNGVLDVKSQSNPDTLNTLCRIMKINISNCAAKVQFYGLYLTQKDAVAFTAGSCDMIYIKACQAIESATLSYGFDFTYATARLYGCKCQNHRNCIRSYLSNISSESWADSSAAEWGISVSGGKLSKVGNQPSGTYGPESIQDGGIIVSKYGGSIGALINSVTLYVATTGSDITGSGSSSSPYRTIQYALNTIPKDLGGHLVEIIASNGIYDEALLIRGFHSGRLKISSTSPEIVNTDLNVNSITISHCNALIWIAGLCVTSNENAIAVQFSDKAMISYTLINASGGYGVVFEVCSNGRVISSTVSNRTTAIRFVDSSGYVYSVTGSNNNIGVSANGNAVVHLINTIPGATTPKTQGSGGAFINENGTQISELINSGLACTWGTISGGIVRNGITGGTGMITIVVQITTTVQLTSGQQYNISGFPIPSTGVPVAVASNASTTIISWLGYTNGTIGVIPTVNVASNTILQFNVTYPTKS